MSFERTPPLKTAKTRLFRDFLTRISVSFGAMLVLASLFLIFFYLLHVVEPVFESAKIEKSSSFSSAHEALYVGIDEQAEIGYRITPQFDVEFFSLEQADIGALVRRVRLDMDVQIEQLYASEPRLSLLALATSHNELMMIRPTYRVDYIDQHRLITPNITYPFSQKALSILPAGIHLKQLAFTADDESLKVVAYGSDDYFYLSEFSRTGRLLASSHWPAMSDTSPAVNTLSNLYVVPDGSRVLAVFGNELRAFNTRFTQNIRLLGRYELSTATVTSTAFLSIGSSILVGDDNGNIAQWFEVNAENGPEYVKARMFSLGKMPIKAIYPEHYRKGFFALDTQNVGGLFYTTSHRELWKQALMLDVKDFVFSPRARSAVIIDTQRNYSLYQINNEHPEITWSALWEKVWYEGYEAPDYVWQSSSASDEFEAKLSLMPLSFGTIKAAAFAMLFSIPIGLAAAVYTAYFMSPSMRNIVKPTIELLEALPTVILGFLAGLWLAPVIEANLASVFFLFIFLPLTVLGLAWCVHCLPHSLRNRLPSGFEPFLLVVAFIVLGMFLFRYSIEIEHLFFGMHLRDYITNEWNIDFNQRNSIVIGIAMAIAVIPTIFAITEDAVFSVPGHLSQGSLALGASQWQTLTRVVLLTASPGIFSAVMMGLGRAVGETMIVLMATGNTPIMDWSMFEGMRTLAANIAIEMPESEVNSSHYRLLFLAALVLFVFTFAFNTVAEFVRQRLREKYRLL